MPANPAETPHSLTPSEGEELYDKLPEPQRSMIGTERTDRLSTGVAVRSVCVSVGVADAGWAVEGVNRKAKKKYPGDGLCAGA